MKLLELTLPTTEENLALDEVLLASCETSDQPCEILRLWENPVQAVILGRSSQVAMELDRQYCNERGIRHYRRSSGGASVVIGPGCLMYAVVLDYRLRPELRMLDRAHQFVMQRMVDALESCDLTIEYQGTCDLTLDNKKFSGNSLRCQRNCFLYHGTLLYDFPLASVQQCLGTPPRQPDYRQGRTHSQFLVNLPVSRKNLIDALRQQWAPSGKVDSFDNESVQELALHKFASAEWNDKR